MIQKTKMFILSISSLLILALPAAFAPVVVHASTPADIQSSVCSGAQNLQISTTPTAQCPDGSTQSNGVNTILTEVINVFSAIVGVISVIMIIFGGFRYITSGGAQEKVTSAKNTIIYAVIGLIIVALAQIIVKFVLGKSTSAAGSGT